MLYDQLRTLKARGAVIAPRGGEIVISPKEAADGFEGGGELLHFLNRWGGGPAWALLDVYLSGYKLLRTPRELKEAVEKLRASPAISMDLETTGLDPREDRVRLISMADALDVYVVDVKAPAMYGEDIGATIKPLFDGKRRVVFHNAAFDLEFLAYMGIEPAPRSIYDTGTAEQLIQALDWMPPLKALARYYAGLDIDKALQRSDWDGKLTEEQLRYSALDARVTFIIYEKQREELRRLGLERVADIEFRAIPAGVWMRMSGVPFDLKSWYRVAEEETVAMREVLKELEGYAPGINWNSPEQVLEVLRRAGLELEDTRDETLKHHVDHPIVRALLRYREHKKRTSSYGPDWEKYINERTGRLHPSWKLIGAKTGRMSCAGPNLMQVPREEAYRKCFRAPEGRVLIKADYSQIELCLAATIAEDHVMLKAFEKGEDLHRKTAAAILQKPEKDVTTGERQMAKSVNFGNLYGMGSQTFKEYAYTNYGVKLSLEEAQKARRVFFDTYPGIRRWHMSQAEGPVEVRTLAGRRRVTDKFTAKLNTPVQGSGADIIKLALALLYERRNELPGVFPILAVHDEIVMEAPVHLAKAAMEHLVKAMQDAAKEVTGGRVNIKVEAGVYKDWSAKEAVVSD